MYGGFSFVLYDANSYSISFLVFTQNSSDMHYFCDTVAEPNNLVLRVPIDSISSESQNLCNCNLDFPNR